MSNIIKLLLIFTLSVSISSYTFAQQSSAQPTFRVGVIQSLTGIAAEDGKTVVQSLRIAVDDINSSSSPKVELIIEDDQTDSKKSVNAYQKLRAQGIDVIIGATWDFTTNPLLPLIGRDKVILFSTSTLPESLLLEESKGYGFINAIATIDDAKPFGRFLQKSTFKTAVILYANNSWGETQRKVYHDITEKAGIEILDEIKPASYDENEWRVMMPRIRAKNPDIVVLLVNKQDVETILKRAQEIHLSPRFFATKNAFHIFKESSSKQLFEGLCFTYPYEQLANEKKFTDHYKEIYKEDALVYADNSYDSLFLLHNAYKTSREKNISIREALISTESDGLVGHYRYDNQRSFSLGTASLVCVKSGEVQLNN